jgi:valyl-tRNA synthetase
MSKSKGNVIDPLELINEYGADPLRFTLISMASPGRDVKLSKDRVTGYRNFLTKVWSANNFLKLNNCKYNKKFNVKKINLKVNQWIYTEFCNANKLIIMHIQNFRFDEASRIVYNFVWRSYCDWYLEFLKPIFNSKNKNSIKEAKQFSSFMLLNILKLLHPFIPFFTEHIWQENKFNKEEKTDLINSNWPDSKKVQIFKKNYEEIQGIIDIITEIRSTKVQLSVPPKEYCDIVYFQESKKTKKFINNNLEIIKQVARVNKIVLNSINNNSIIQIIVLKEKLGLKFETNIDLNSQKYKLVNKLKELEKKIISLNQKLDNINYVKKAPKNIVTNDKVLLKDLKIEETKLKSIVSSIN